MSFLLHQFSPQRTDPAILTETLVSRRALLDEVLDKIRSSASTGAQHHFMLIGPRGIGKTNFLTLVQHELHQSSTDTPNLRLAWLNEDEVSATFLLLLRRIYRALAVAYPDEYPSAVLDSVQGQSADVALGRLTDGLVKRAAKHKVLVLIENVDEHLSKMKIEEQKRWRAFLQNHKAFITLASAQKLSADISKRAKPFFNFFDVRTLQPLSVEEARELLVRIAHLRNGPQDARLIQFLETPQGLGRLRAIHALAGGNPRLYVLLSELLTAEDLDDVVKAFEEMVDRQLTTYYQERLRWVSGQQQEIIHELCRARAPISVNRIAQGIFATNQTVSRQLKELSNMGYVQSHSLGRESVYELSEPLMRLVLEAKQGSGQGRLKLIVEFLRLWFEPEELREKLEFCQSDLSKSYLEEALKGAGDLSAEIDWSRVPSSVVALGSRLEEETDPVRRIEILKKIFEDHQLPNQLAAFLLVVRASEKLKTNDIDGALEDADRAIHLEVPPTVLATLYLVRGTAHLIRQDWEKALTEVTDAIRAAGPLQVAQLRVMRAQLHWSQGNAAAAKSDVEEALRLPELATDVKTTALFVQARLLDKAEDWSGYISTCDKLLALNSLTAEQRWRATFCRATGLSRSDISAALEGFTLAIALANTPDQLSETHVSRARIYEQLGDKTSATTDLELAINVPRVEGSALVSALLARVAFYTKSKQYGLAMTDANRAVAQAETAKVWSALAYQMRGMMHEVMGNYAKALTDYDMALSAEATGVGDPTLDGIQRRSLVVQRGSVLLRLDQIDEARASLEGALGSYEGGPFSGDGDLVSYALGLAILFAQEPGSVSSMAQKLVSVASTAGELGKLGNALVQQLKSFRTEKASARELLAWEETWMKAGAEHEALIIPLRLLQAGLRYLAEPHEKFLLALPLEERQLLHEPLGLS